MYFIVAELDYYFYAILSFYDNNNDGNYGLNVY